MMASTPLAIGTGKPERPRNLVNVTVLMLITGGTALFATLIGAYTALKQHTSQWPPPAVHLDNYVGTMLTLTAIMSALTVEWAVYSAKRSDTALTIWGLAMTLGFGLAFLNLLWYLGRSIGFGPGDLKIGPYATMFYAMIVAAGFVAVLGLGAIAATLARALGRQMTPTHHEMLRGAAWFWDFVVLAWIAVYATLWLYS
jgi:heme/copper-type cytochrome/quinol oxidase subunit 3